MKQYKIIACLFFLLLAAGTISAGFSYYDYTTKWQLCTALNFSYIACDTWWQTISDMPGNTTQDTVNMAEIELKINSTILAWLANYYNKTDIDINLSQISENATSFDLSYWTSEDRNDDERIMTEKDWKQSNQDMTYNSSVEKESSFDPIWLLVIAVVGVMAFLVAKPYLQSKYSGQHSMKPQVREQVPVYNGSRPKIQGRATMQKESVYDGGKPDEDEIERLMNQKKKLELENELYELEMAKKMNEQNKTGESWIEHVKKFRESHPELSYKEALQEAKKTYK